MCVCVHVLVLTHRGLDIKMYSVEMSHMLLLSGCVTLRALPLGGSVICHHISLICFMHMQIWEHAHTHHSLP